MKGQIFALVDCNSMYASCERLFRPDLRNRPVIVASNNDGCVVARSKEAKLLGIKMGVPLFQINHLIESGQVECFSSNYALYADISARVMQTLEEFSPAVEVYSIDEAFLSLTDLPASTDLLDLGKRIRNAILKNVGMPVCVGISTTKTLAKLANHAAKTYPATDGVVDLTDRNRQRRLLGLLPAGEVWGVGSKIAARLQVMGVKTALDLADADAKWIRSHFSVVEERICKELSGQSCIELQETNKTKQQILCSRSFGEKITILADMRTALSSYAVRAAEKLRAEEQLAKTVSIFVRTSVFSDNEPRYSNSASIRLTHPTDDSRRIVKIAARLLESIWRDGFRYAKAGIMLGDFTPRGMHQHDLFSNVPDKDSRSLMAVLDKINSNGRGKLFFASEGLQNTWAMKRERLSPAYTTRWSDIPRVK